MDLDGCLDGIAFCRFGPELQKRHEKVLLATIDHAIWFHRPFKVDDWLLYDMDSPSASSGRGFNRGNIYNQQGQLVASVCQEALIRKRQNKV